jgi:enoyl-[acyl-carrier protein] reductase/trans-2-enoyl-CoA reductase (NAD+)
VRTDPETGVVHRSVLKPLGQDFTAKSIDPFKGEIRVSTVTPATEEEAAATVKVMGGEDWDLWIDALEKAQVLAPGFSTVAYSYIGPQVTYPFYRSGTIGKAKEHLEATSHTLSARLKKSVGGSAFVSVNKALVTRASAVIPAVSLYISLLYKVMKKQGTHEGCIEQIDRLFRDRLYSGHPVAVDADGMIRIDDWEMAPLVQAEVAGLWDKVTGENLRDLCDVKGFEQDFLQLNGFAVPGVDYEAEVDQVVLENGA